MNNSGTFPFGWIREVRGDNWQIIWSPSSGNIYLKAVTSNDIVEFDYAESWEDAKSKCDKLISSPDTYKKLF